jgi:YidC/Oxa1 family membrane protein insertase
MNEILSIPYNIILQTLLFLYNLLFQNMGLAIIALTVLLRALMVPLTLPATKAQKKMADLKPHLDALKEKHKDDKVKMQEEQLKLYQEHGINPAASCLPYIVQIIVLIVLYQVLVKYLGPEAKIDGKLVNTSFFYLDLAKHDQFYIFPVVAGVTQFILSKMMTPTKALEVKKNDSQEEKKDKQDFAEAMQEVQGQMVYMMPIMTTIVSLNFPSGLALYWVVGNLFSIAQQYFITGPGGLSGILKKKTD